MSAGEPDPTAETTSWTAIGRGDLEYVIRRYWRPVYGFLAPRLGRDEAEEATQEFFLRFVQRETIQKLDEERGRARSFIFHLARQFLVDRYRRESTAKRGGGAEHVGSDALAGVAAPEESPDDRFDQEWFETLIQRARRAVKATYVSRGKPLPYQAFKLFYFSGATVTQSEVAETLGIPVTQVNNYLHRCRKVYAEALRELVADTCAPDQVDSELAELGELLERYGLSGPPPSTFFFPLAGGGGEES